MKYRSQQQRRQRWRHPISPGEPLDTLRHLRSELSVVRIRLEQLAVRESQLATQMSALRRRVDELQRELRRDVRELEHAMTGNGQAGMKLRLDRLEHADRWRRRQAALLWGAVVAAALNALAMWLSP